MVLPIVLNPGMVEGKQNRTIIYSKPEQPSQLIKRNINLVYGDSIMHLSVIRNWYLQLNNTLHKCIDKVKSYTWNKEFMLQMLSFF